MEQACDYMLISGKIKGVFVVAHKGFVYGDCLLVE